MSGEPELRIRGCDLWVCNKVHEPHAHADPDDRYRCPGWSADLEAARRRILGEPADHPWRVEYDPCLDSDDASEVLTLRDENGHLLAYVTPNHLRLTVNGDCMTAWDALVAPFRSEVDR